MAGLGQSYTRRFDIQVMRGVAVLAVVLFHALPAYLPKGYLGVDIFFVISGFLITRILLRDIGRGTFSFARFYKRRAVRLLPASLTTLAVTTVLAAFFLTQAEMADYAKQLIGSLTFTANFALAQQTSYFGAAAETKPLLHIWSLSLEEQFYFVAPLLLWVTPKRRRPQLLIAGAVLSFALCWLFVSRPEWLTDSPKTASKAAFFMLPTRAWELLAGGICAWAMLKRPDLRVPQSLKIGALVGIAPILAIGVDAAHPGLDALIVVGLTSIVLLGQDGWLPSTESTRAVGIVGNWSYSLYLVHWPLFAFAYVSYGQTPPQPVLILLVFVALLFWVGSIYVCGAAISEDQPKPETSARPWCCQPGSRRSCDTRARCTRQRGNAAQHRTQPGVQHSRRSLG